MVNMRNLSARALAMGVFSALLILSLAQAAQAGEWTRKGMMQLGERASALREGGAGGGLHGVWTKLS